jgi:hypothetical protein
MPAILQAQMNPEMDVSKGQGSFKVGATDGWTLGAPHLDLNGGLFYAAEKDGMKKVQEGFVSVRYQIGLGTQHVQLAGNALFVPKLGGSSNSFTTLLQLVPTDQDDPIHFSIGAGMVAGRFGGDRRVDPWAEAVLALRTPIHVIAPFVQIGQGLRSGSRTEILIGASHPLAPYKFHLFH